MIGSHLKPLLSGYSPDNWSDCYCITLKGYSKVFNVLDGSSVVFVNVYKSGS